MRRFLLLLCCLMMCAFPALAETFPPTSTPTLRGIDVSAWQRDIDWGAVKGSGVDIALIRSSEGESVVDAYFERNYAGAKAASVAVGFYHFMTAETVEEAIRQADFFISVIDGKEADCLLALDVGGGSRLSNEEITAVASAFLGHVEEKTGLGVMLYTDAWAAKARFGESLAKYPIWVANYGVEEPEANGKWAYWVGFQYSDEGKVPGITGRVDLDQFTKEVYQGAAPTPTPAPTPGPESEMLCFQVKADSSADDLAAQLGTTAADLEEHNDLSNGVAHRGQLIRYPAVGVASDAPFAGLHILQNRESLRTIARRYGVSVDELVSLNGLTGRTAPVGQVLKVPAVGGSVASSPSWIVESAVVVQAGQSIDSIAALYGISAANLRVINGLDEDTPIYRGQILHLTAYGSGESSPFAGGYVVNQHDTLTRIARRFGVSVDALAGANNLDDPRWIYPGMVLLIPR